MKQIQGIETRAELETLIKLGVNYGQGYYIARPEPQIVNKIIKVKKKY